MDRFSLFVRVFLAAGLASLAAGQSRSFEQPVVFERNEGQADHSVKFVARTGNFHLFLTNDAAMQLSGLTIRLQEANRNPKMTALEEQRGVSNYLSGADPARWVVGVRRYARVRYEQVYPGVDLVYYGTEHQLEHDFIVAPGADYRRIAVRFDGATSVRLAANGDLQIKAPGGELVQKRPVIFQQSGDQRKTVAGGYRVSGGVVSFHVDRYDPSLPLIIDPTFTYFSTYLDGSGVDQPSAIAADAQGNAYVTGNTSSLNFPTKNPAQAKLGGSTDVFVTKLDGATGAIVYSTYLGGSSDESSAQIKVDATGSAYIVGATYSSDFPVTQGAFQKTLGGTSDAFVAKLNPAGNALVYSTYLGGSGDDGARGLDIDPHGDAFVVGVTFSGDFPVHGTLYGQSPLGAGVDAFLTELNPTGSSTVYSGYMGGNGIDCLNSVAVNSLGEANVVGFTTSTDLPTTVQDSRWPYLSGGLDAFMAKVSPSGLAIEYISYYGGSLDDIATTIVADPRDDVTVYITGVTASPDFPTVSGAPVNVGTGQALPFVTEFQLPGIVFVAGNQPAGDARLAGEIDNNPFLQTPPADCPGGDWGPLVKQMRDDLSDSKKLNTFLNSFQDVGLAIITPAQNIGVMSKDPSDFCTGSGSSPQSSTLALREAPRAQPTSTPLLYAINLSDGSPADVPPFPTRATGTTTSIYGLATDLSGTVYLAVRTTNSALPVVSPLGEKPGTGAMLGYITRLSTTAPAPALASVVNGASFGSTPVAPGGLISLFGKFYGTTTPVTASATPLPVSLGSTSVTINGTQIPLYYVSPTQINAQVPWEAALGPATAVVTSGGAVSPALTFTVGATGPGIFTFGTNRAVAQNQDFSLNNTGSPAAVGSYVTVYMTGGGAVDNPITTGAVGPSSPLSRVSAAAMATIGGQTAQIQFLGMTPGLVGVVQANLQVPALSPGDYPLAITIGGLKTNAPLITVSAN